MTEPTRTGGQPQMIVTHLVDVEDRKTQILEDYLSYTSPSERQRAIELIDSYISALEDWLTCRRPNETIPPFAAAGSLVTVKNLDNEREHRIRIILPGPESEVREKNCTRASLFSPVGSALVLRRSGEEVTVEAPGGKYRYQVLNVEAPEGWA